MTDVPFPPDLVLDVHDLATIILDCHAQLETRFAKTKLLEINRGTSPLQTLSDAVLPPEWDALSPGQRRVAYILQEEPYATTRVTIDTFAHPDGVKTSDNHTSTRRELEDVYWRCKDFDSGYVLAYVAQQVFDALPPTAKLRARTSAAHLITCAPSEVTVAEIKIQLHEACLMEVVAPQPHLWMQHLSGFDGSMPWVYLLIGKPTSMDLEKDTRVVLDLVLPQIGGRGGGGELFALERGLHYHDDVLSKYADEFQGFKLSEKLRLSPPHIRRHGEAVKAMVLERLAKVVAGEEQFCAYCGKAGAELRCSKCKSVRFCKDCHVLGWKYHKVWCKPSEA
ncbi:hypothetical protein OBBRIDRAFT_787186 [Obba rivulosa]|uniref:MYND-type domain-containing protein n=1 Tax=Obba rivulosa TaxID=1052685 RepID=A0A8E2DVW2_9APHY|nr:hypothetical protein OBBRIDRAFT_787186 [Obba rivulosa]